MDNRNWDELDPEEYQDAANNYGSLARRQTWFMILGIIASFSLMIYAIATPTPSFNNYISGLVAFLCAVVTTRLYVGVTINRHKEHVLNMALRSDESA